MSVPSPVRPGPRPVALALVAVAFGGFGLLGGLPYFAGVAVGVGGLLAAEATRRLRPWGSPSLPLLPAIGALLVLAVSAPATPAVALAGGLAAVALLLWLALDPTRLAGAARRAAPTLGYCVAALAVAWAVTVALPNIGSAVGVAGGLLAVVVLVLVLLLERGAEGDAGGARVGGA